MAQKYEKVVQEDLNIGTGMVWVKAPASGDLRATQVGLHTVARNQLSYTSSWTPGAIATTSNASTTISVPNAAVGDMVLASHDKMLTNALRITGHVSASGTVRVVIHNPTASTVTVAAGTLEVIVFPFASANASPPPIADFSYEQTAGGEVGEGIIAFTDATSGGTPPYVTYAWDFGDGVGTSSDASPTYTYDDTIDPGALEYTFTVTLTVTDSGGQTDSVSGPVLVQFNQPV